MGQWIGLQVSRMSNTTGSSRDLEWTGSGMGVLDEAGGFRRRAAVVGVHGIHGIYIGSKIYLVGDGVEDLCTGVSYGMVV